MKLDWKYSLSVFLVLYGFVLLVLWSMSDKEYTVEIPQNIGGKLNCEVNEWQDIQNWGYLVKYKYIDENNVSSYIGTGSFDGREWDNKAQIIHGKDMYLLKVGDGEGDSLYIRKPNSLWKKLQLKSEIVLSSELWKSKHIKLINGSGDANIIIKEIVNSDEIKADFIYRDPEDMSKVKGLSILLLLDPVAEKVVLKNIY